jgi:alcohol dehydrogenase class IV
MEVNMSSYVYVTTDYIMGRESIRSISDFKDGKIALVIDSRVIKGLKIENKLYDDILKDCNYKVICDISNEPTEGFLNKYIETIRDYEPKYIIAIGGGSVIDTAKALWLFYELPDYTWEKAYIPYGIEKFPGKASLIAIPTTSGTGSETTCAAVIKDNYNNKQLILTPEIIPTKAILDFNLLTSLPPKVIAYSGTDALAHSIESATSKIASPMVVNVGTYAAIEIISQLPKSFDGDEKARERVHVASSQAGAAICNSITGLAHGLDNAGGDFKLPHGLVTGMLLPYTMKFLIPNIVYEEIAAKLGITGDSKEKQEKLVDKIFELNKNLGMPSCFKELGIDEKEYISNIEGYIETAKNNPNVLNAARIPNEEELRKLYLEFYYGKQP